jgi:hypothetical protein
LIFFAVIKIHDSRFVLSLLCFFFLLCKSRNVVMPTVCTESQYSNTPNVLYPRHMFR